MVTKLMSIKIENLMGLLTYRSGLLKNTSYQKFVILSRKRSESTYLQRKLNVHPNIRCYAELFLSNDYLDWGIPQRRFDYHHKKLMQLYREDPICFIDEAIYGSAEKHVKASGFKLFFNQPFESPRRQTVWNKILNDENIAKILFTRRNHLHTVVSKYQAI